MHVVLEATATIAAFAAAACWFRSAMFPLSQTLFATKWDNDGAEERAYLLNSAWWNRWAAFLSGISALSFALLSAGKILGE